MSSSREGRKCDTISADSEALQYTAAQEGGATVDRDSWIFMWIAHPTVELGLRSSAPEHTSSTNDVLPTPESPSTRMRTFSAFCRPSAIAFFCRRAAGER